MRLVLSDPGLRLAALLMVLFGALTCGFGPYVSLLAIHRFGLGDSGYVAVLATASVLSVTSAVWVGIRSDQTGRRRRLALATTLSMTAGLSGMAIWPAPATFVLAHAILIPFGMSLYGQTFALARILASRRPAAERDRIMAVLRALLALPFVMVLPVWSLVFAAGAPLLTIYPVGLAFATLMVGLTLARWPSDAELATAPSGLSFRGALAEIARPRVGLRVLALGGVGAATTVYMAVVALTLSEEVGRGPADAALYVGLIAGFEIPFMLAIPRLSHVPRPLLILIGAVMYGSSLAGMHFLAESALVWLLVLPAAAGGALILLLPIAYLQDLLGDRPGTGAALMSVQKLASDALAAASFALGSLLGGYGMVAMVGALVSVTGAAILLAADRRGRQAGTKSEPA